MGTMRISQLAERSGVPATTLRFYETEGLLPADRTPAGYRVYGEDALERLGFIAAAKHLGLPLEQISELLEVWESEACAQVKTDLRPRITARLREAEQRVADLTAFIASLHSALHWLDALPDRAGRCDSECGFLTSPPPAADRPVDASSVPASQASEAGTERWRTAPVACSLTDENMGKRAAAWHTAVDGAHRAEIPDGLQLTVPVDRAAMVAGLAAAEQQCCPFLDFRIHIDGHELHLTVRSPAEGADLLTELFGSARL